LAIVVDIFTCFSLSVIKKMSELNFLPQKINEKEGK